jgi:hypothetical protein
MAGGARGERGGGENVTRGRSSPATRRAREIAAIGAAGDDVRSALTRSGIDGGAAVVVSAGVGTHQHAAARWMGAGWQHEETALAALGAEQQHASCVMAHVIDSHPATDDARIMASNRAVVSAFVTQSLRDTFSPYPASFQTKPTGGRCQDDAAADCDASPHSPQPKIPSRESLRRAYPT